MMPAAPPSCDGPSTQPSRQMLVALIVVLALGLLVRLPALVAMTSPGAVWDDPDGYAYAGALVADNPGRWLWVRDVVQFLQYLKAPLYPAMMCAFAVVWRSGFPASAAVFQILLAVAGGFALFKIGQYLHSPKAGLIATALYLFHLPGFSNVIFLQETVFFPLMLISFAMLFRTTMYDGRWWNYALVGVLFGLTALTRSLPLYFLPPVLALHVFWSADRRVALRRAGVLSLTFALTILPYSVFISAKWGQWVFVDTQGMRSIVERYSDSHGASVPGAFEAVSMLGNALVADPVGFVLERAEKTKAFFYLKGGQWLQVYAPRPATRGGALALKVLAHLTHDLPVAVALLLSPFGFVFARRPRETAWLVLWPVVALALMVPFLWGGARYTASFLPHLMVGAAVVLAGGWRRPARASVIAAAACSLLVAVPLVMSVPLSASGRADYGVRFAASSQDATRSIGTMTGQAGFSVRAERGEITLVVSPRDLSVRDDEPAWMEIWIDGSRQPPLRLRPARTERISIRTQRGLVFIELRVVAGDSAPRPTGAPLDLEIVAGTINRGLCAGCP